VYKRQPLDVMDGVRECEKAIEKVMGVIRYNFKGRYDSYTEMSGLAAVKERIQFLQIHANDFASRFHLFVVQFFASQAQTYLLDKTRASQRNALKLYAHEQLEQKLFKFKGLTNWLKETDVRKHQELQQAYVTEMGSCYTKEINEFIDVLKYQHIQKRNLNEELDYCIFWVLYSVCPASDISVFGDGKCIQICDSI
jgi:hypothetical protein